MEHTRVVIATHGFPLKSFIDCLELVQALLAAVKGLHSLYKVGILHRDVSVGNILITRDCKVSGALIDIENDITPESHKTVWHDKLTGTVAFLSVEIAGQRSLTVAFQDQGPRTDDLDDDDDDDDDTVLQAMSDEMNRLKSAALVARGSPGNRIVEAELPAFLGVRDKQGTPAGNICIYHCIPAWC